MKRKRGPDRKRAVFKKFLSWSETNGLKPPADLLDDLKNALEINGKPRGGIRLRGEMEIAILASALNPVLDKKLSNRKLASLCGTSRQTVILWKKDSNFDSTVKSLRIRLQLMKAFAKMEGRVEFDLLFEHNEIEIGVASHAFRNPAGILFVSPGVGQSLRDNETIWVRAQHLTPTPTSPRLVEFTGPIP